MPDENKPMASADANNPIAADLILDLLDRDAQLPNPVTAWPEINVWAAC